MPQGKTPEKSRQPKNDSRSDHQLEHKLPRLSERFDQESCRDICHDYYRNNPPENKAKDPWKDHIGITRDIEEVEIAVNKALCAHDPKADRGQAKHDRVMDGNAKTERG